MLGAQVLNPEAGPVEVQPPGSEHTLVLHSRPFLKAGFEMSRSNPAASAPKQQQQQAQEHRPGAAGVSAAQSPPGRQLTVASPKRAGVRSLPAAAALGSGWKDHAGHGDEPVTQPATVSLVEVERQPQQEEGEDAAKGHSLRPRDKIKARRACWAR